MLVLNDIYKSYQVLIIGGYNEIPVIISGTSATSGY